ncbi:MAG: dihydroneopterin triphosphate 2'-epimerase [bacterium]|nr:MAG: dihydroneopterin triphosphate 2'-epimerase [bacterium]
MTITIKNLRLKGIIGIYEAERHNKQDIIIHVKIDFDGDQAAQKDEIKETIDYDSITNKIVDLVDKSKFYLLEKLAYQVLGIVMKDERVTKAWVEVEKPQAIPLADSVSVSCSGDRETWV